MKSILARLHASSGLHTRTLLFLVLLLLSGCMPQATPTSFVPPTAANEFPAAVPTSSTASIASSPTPRPTNTVPPPTPTPCTNDLLFVQDLTIPDGTSVSPGMPVDKQWLVTNSGTCNWGTGYRLKLITGEAMGAATEQALYPARSGTQATLRVLFTAPQDAGTHHGAWQAFAPDGAAFGQAVYVQLNVTP